MTRVSGQATRCDNENVKTRTEMIEGPEAWTRFTNAMKAIVKVPKNALPESPFGKRKQTKKPAPRKG
jgi:hypothetical protein